MHKEQKGPPHSNLAGAILYHFCLFIIFIDAAMRDVTTIQTSSHFMASVFRTICTLFGAIAAHWYANDWPDYPVGAVIGHLSLFSRSIGRRGESVKANVGQRASLWKVLHQGLGICHLVQKIKRRWVTSYGHWWHRMEKEKDCIIKWINEVALR